MTVRNEPNGKCLCGMDDCWEADDYSWLGSQSGWHGTLHDCETSIFFIHGKKIREQRSVPGGSWPITDLPNLLSAWSIGLPGARLVWSRDTGDGDAGLWIEGEREPDVEDWNRLQKCRDRQHKEDKRTFERLQRKFK